MKHLNGERKIGYMKHDGELKLQENGGKFFRNHESGGLHEARCRSYIAPMSEFGHP